MRNLLAFLAAGVLTFLALGWYLNWYQINSSPSEGGRREVKIELNTSKMGQDLEKGGQKARQLLAKVSKKDKKDTTTEAEVKLPETPVPPAPPAAHP